MERLNKNLLTDEQRIAMEALNIESRVNTKVMEDTEMFLFRTVRPFCETVVERSISKKDLEQAMIKHFPKALIWTENPMTKMPISSCPSCFANVDMFAYGNSDRVQEYCPYCGQHISWEKDGEQGEQ